MHMTAVLRKAADARRSIKSLALSVHFKQPDFGMKDYEILSRATTFLLAVDPKDDATSDEDSKYAFLDKKREERERRARQQDYAYEPVGGPHHRDVKDLGWLEFCPTKFRPVVHCVAASHVLAPWKWGNYYTQDWLTQVKPEHCVHSLEVYDAEKPKEALAKFALNPYPIHHPDGRDMALIHLKQEEEALKHLQSLGVEILYRRDDEKPYEKGEEVTFNGFIVTEENTADKDEFESAKKLNSDDDTRIFLPYAETGNLIFGNEDRFLASTSNPLPEGLCGGPTIDSDGNVCGVVEGIMPEDYPDKRMAGAASFIPGPRLSEFIDFAEHVMLKEIFPEKMYDMVVDYKNGVGKDEVEFNIEGDKGDSDRPEKKEAEAMDSKLKSALSERVESLKKHHSMEEVNAILTTIRRERDEVMDIWNREGGDLDEIIARVRARTRAVQQELMQGLSEDERQDVEKIVGKSGRTSSMDPTLNLKEAEFNEKKEGS